MTPWWEGRHIDVSHEGQVRIRVEDLDGEDCHWERLGPIDQVEAEDLPTAAAAELLRARDAWRDTPSAEEQLREDLEEYWATRGLY
jgi:hypothetical protein